jgi:hypothetical protein
MIVNLALFAIPKAPLTDEREPAEIDHRSELDSMSKSVYVVARTGRSMTVTTGLELNKNFDTVTRMGSEAFVMTISLTQVKSPEISLYEAASARVGLLSDPE